MPKPSQAKLSPVSRILAALLAVVWTAGGIAAVYLAYGAQRWIGLVLGPAAIAYGAAWMRVAQTGRMLRWRGWRR